MTDTEYQQRLKQCKTNEERELLNNEFLKYHIELTKTNKKKMYFKNNILSIIAIVLAIFDLVIAIISLLK